ncbi:class I SAM-dependent methyltransferase [Kyrpidia sp.]|uniref:class I SAM-dependent methyltransferase n=1 Tax=Kyrpidia sp. TaxID=2073077 RepID=UPI00338FA606|nr:class I SAM-dependent methyltransferase [Kyrpidia sp.]
MNDSDEVLRIRQRYERREQIDHSLYHPLDPSVYLAVQERERALIRWIHEARLLPVSERRVLEVGCGSGANLLTLIRLGFRPENLMGIDLLEERAAYARTILPPTTRILVGDASTFDFGKSTFDVVLQFTVFTSILDPCFQERLADRMWSWVKPGGGILWYDFTFNNPKNPDVKGIPYHRVRKLFPRAQFKVWRLTLAPPISRKVTRVNPNLYHVFNLFPFLRTHIMCWIYK